jgi:hypothetical protein
MMEAEAVAADTWSDVELGLIIIRRAYRFDVVSCWFWVASGNLSRLNALHVVLVAPLSVVVQKLLQFLHEFLLLS